MQSPEHALDKALSLLKHDWVHSFLLDNDYRGYIDQIYGALNRPSVVKVNFHFSSTSQNPHASILDQSRNLLMLSSFTKGNLTAGFEINERVTSTGPVEHDVPFSVSPFIRDDKQGIILVVGEQLSTGMMEINCAVQSSPGCRSQVLALVDAKMFRSAVANIAHSYDPDAVRNAIVMSYNTLDARQCVRCGIISLQPCACPLLIAPKIHDNDFHRDIANVATFVGPFQGVATMRIKTPTGVKSLTNLITKVESIFSTDYESQKKLSFWAMLDATQKNKFHVTKTTMPQSSVSHVTSSPKSEKATSLQQLSRTPRSQDDSHTSHSLVKLRPVVQPSPSPSPTPSLSPSLTNALVSPKTAAVEIAPTIVPSLKTITVNTPSARRLTPLAPAPGAQISKVKPDKGPEKGSIEYRRAQNRASAKKSNEKRKRLIQELQTNIDKERTKQEALEQQQAAFQEENKKLRKAAADQTSLQDENGQLKKAAADQTSLQEDNEPLKKAAADQTSR